MLAESATVKHEIKIIGVIDQGANSLSPGDLVYRIAVINRIVLKQIDSVEPGPFVISNYFRANEVFFLIQRLAHQFGRRQGKLHDRAVVQLETAQVWPSPRCRLPI